MKPPIRNCSECETRTATAIQFDGKAFCDIACLLQHVLHNAEEYKSRFLVSDDQPENIQELIEIATNRMRTDFGAYAENPTTCPHCFSDEIRYLTTTPPSLSLKCDECGESWREVWALVGVDDFLFYDLVKKGQVDHE